MTDSNSSGGYFDEAAREGAPSAELKKPKDFVQGEIVDIFKRPQTKFNSKDVIKEDDGSDRLQLVVILQTTSRNWEKVAKVPVGDDGSAVDVAKDNGKRAVYFPKYTNIYGAMGRGVKAAGVTDIEIGGKLGIKVTELEDTGKGNPLKHHDAVYVPPVKSSEEFGDFEDEAKADKPAAEAKSETKKEPETPASSEVEEPPF